MIEKMKEALSIPIINALTDENHPCEMLSDLYSLSKIRPDYLNDKYLFVGEDGNIGRAWREAAKVFGFSLEQCCPPEYQMQDVSAVSNLREAVLGKDIICTDSISSNALEIFKSYQITKEIMSLANNNALLNPCPPFYRGEEVAEDVINSKYFVGYEFKENLLVVQQAIIIYCMPH